MAKYSPADAWLIVSGRDLTGECLNFSDSIEGVTTKTDTLGDSWQEHLAIGLKRATIEQDSWFDDAANSTVATIVSAEQTERVVAWGYRTTAIGKQFTGAKGAFGGTSRRVVSRADLHHCNAIWTVTGQVEDGIILKNPVAETTASGNTEGADSQDNAASSASGGAGYVQLKALTLGGFTNLQLKVRHSADDITYADLVTFAVLTAAPAAERVAVTGTINRHTAMNWAYGGAGAGQSFTALVGFARG